MTSYCRAPVTYTAHQRAIVGDTKMSVIANDHLGWLQCDGRTLNVNDFYLLWRVIGYSFGGSSNTFNLPNASGRVPGVIGTGTDVNSNTQNLALGDMIGEYVHTLTIDEMPSHKHGSVDVTGNTNGDGNTTVNGDHFHTGTTDISGAHSHGINDPGHTHTYLGVQTQNAASGFDNVAENDPRPTETTDSSTTGITIQSDGDHDHTFTTSNAGNHFHSMGSTGGSNIHNNIQPMIGLGNMFIFSGKYLYPSDATTPFAGYPYLSNSQIL
jgi:microcystin-dependent protein